jgi:hypothetical protein
MFIAKMTPKKRQTPEGLPAAAGRQGDIFKCCFRPNLAKVNENTALRDTPGGLNPYRINSIFFVCTKPCPELFEGFPASNL